MSEEIDEATLSRMVKISEHEKHPVFTPAHWYSKHCWRCKAPLNNSHYLESCQKERLCSVCEVTYNEWD